MSTKTCLRNWKISPSHIPETRNHFTGSIQFGRLIYWFFVSTCSVREEGSTASHIICQAPTVEFNTGAKKTKGSKYSWAFHLEDCGPAFTQSGPHLSCVCYNAPDSVSVQINEINEQYHKGETSIGIPCSAYRPLGMLTSDMVRPMLWWIWMSSVIKSWGKSRNAAARNLFPKSTS